MATNICQKCGEEHTHGYQFTDVLNSDKLGGNWVTMFICDACLSEAKKESKHGMD